MQDLRPSSGFSVCVAGVPGVGKTLLIREFAQGSESLDRHLTGSSVIKAIIAPATVQDFDKWSEADRTAVREAAIVRLFEMKAETPGRLLIDGHFTLRNRYSGEIEDAFTDGDRRFYDALILVQATPQQILAWRTADSRDRGVTTMEAIGEHMAREYEEGLRQAALMGVPLLILDVAELDARLSRMKAFLDQVARLVA